MKKARDPEIAAFRHARRKASLRLHRTMQDLGVTPQQICAATGIDIDVINNLGRVCPHSSTIIQLSKYLQRYARKQAPQLKGDSKGRHVREERRLQQAKQAIHKSAKSRGTQRKESQG